MTLAERVYRDYIDVIKMIVVPEMDAAAKLKLREVRVLMSLGYSTAAVSASELAEQLRQDPSTVTRSLLILVRGGFIKTFENQADGRSKMIALTEEGEILAMKCRNVLEGFLAEIDQTDGLEDSLRPDEIYVERLTDISKRASFVLEQAKRKS